MGNPGAQKERRDEADVVCSIVAKNGRELSNAGEHGKFTISYDTLEGSIHPKVIKYECIFDEKTGLSVRIIDGKTVKVDPKLMKETLETRRKQGRTIKTRREPVIDNMNNINENVEGPEI